MSRKKNASDQLTLFAAVSHASHSATQESETERQMTATSGRRCYGSLERLNRPGLSAKTLLASCRWTAGLYSNRYALRWKLKATPSKRLYCQLFPVEHRTEEIGFGLLLTPGVVMHEEHPEDYKARTVEKGYDRNNEWTSLAAQIKYMGLLPTPAAQEPGFKTENRNPVDKEGNPAETHNHRWYDPETGRLMQKGLSHAIEILPTPTNRDYRAMFADNSEAYKARLDHPRGVNLVEQLQRVNNGANTGMKLQPAFVEYMMGYPEGWTEIRGSKPSETP